MPNALEVLGAFYEISTVVTDIILNHEYIKRKWKEEYALSIAFLVFNGLVMAIVGLQLEAKRQRKRYVRWGPLNTVIGGVIGLLQLRVLVETLYAYAASSRAEKDEKGQSDPQYQQQEEETAKERATRLDEGLVYVAFIQAMVRDVPVFIIQANATIHYRKWKLVDLWAVVSTGVTLLNAVSSYATTVKTTTKGTTTSSSMRTTCLGIAATLFLMGQFVFRLGAILLVATTTGLSIVAYAGAITVLAIAAAIALRLAMPAQSTGAQVSSAILFFPLFTVFTIDAGHLGPLAGDVKRALYSPKLLLLNAWRVIENTVGVLLAVLLPRYTDFGHSTDQEIALIGIACGAFYLVTLLVFVVAARAAPNETSDELAGEDTTLYLQNAPASHEPRGQPQSQGYY